VTAYRTVKGAMDPKLLYASPFTDISPSGPEQVFDEVRVSQLVRIIRQFSDAQVA
jgi:type I restriction enzyme, R subunit